MSQRDGRVQLPPPDCGCRLAMAQTHDHAYHAHGKGRDGVLNAMDSSESSKYKFQESAARRLKIQVHDVIISIGRNSATMEDKRCTEYANRFRASCWFGSWSTLLFVQTIDTLSTGCLVTVCSYTQTLAAKFVLVGALYQDQDTNMLALATTLYSSFLVENATPSLSCSCGNARDSPICTRPCCRQTLQNVSCSSAHHETGEVQGVEMMRYQRGEQKRSSSSDATITTPSLH